MLSQANYLSTLERLQLRDVWPHEARDFTTWLAQEENLLALSDVLGISIVNAQTEAPVGSFNVDILAEDDENHSVIIENQLETTDHDHLGKLLTYAAGLDARTIVWIVDKAREEHTNAVGWLNDHTTDEANFFLIRIEVWKIDESRPAPRFNVVVQPNGWTKAARQSKNSVELSETKLQQRAFFVGLREHGIDRATNIKRWPEPRAQQWYNIPIGNAGCHLATTVNSFTNTVTAQLYIPNSEDLFERLENGRSDIEQDLGFELDWQSLPERKASRIAIERDGDYRDENRHDELFRWLTDKLDAMAQVFPDYISTAKQ